MNLPTLLLGVAAVAYGAYTAWARTAKPDQFKKLQPMKEFWGERRGILIHTVGYTIVPIILGLVLVAAGLAGKSPF